MQSELATAVARPQRVQRRTATCNVRAIESRTGMELYITATPGDGSARCQAEQLYSDVADVLRQTRSLVVQERLFASADAMSDALGTRARICAPWDDGIAPTQLIAPGADQRLLGVQLHAICGITQPTVLSAGGGPLARTFDCNGVHYLTATALRAPHLSGGAEQTRAAFSIAENLLGQAHGTLADLARTWIWMDDILSWYPELNQVRNRFFTQRGLMGSANRMPASTGIGVSPAWGGKGGEGSGGARVALDLFAAWGGARGQADAVERFHAAGNQRSAYEYGSAFARAARVQTPGGLTVFCSGTAAIDAQGKTCFLNDAPGQIRMTLDNVQAVLRDMHCSHGDVVQAMAYCATSQVEQCFRDNFAEKLPWPCLCVIGDVCRRDLLFEVEVTACPNAHRI